MANHLNEDPQASSANPSVSPPVPTESNPTPAPAKPRSEAQQRASRENGSKSEGPVTPEGKSISKMNPTTHGGYASTVVIERGVLAEDPEAYETGLKAFLAAKKPLNAAAQEFCVQMYNQIHKLNRMDRFEAMAIEATGTLPDREYEKAIEEAQRRHKFAQVHVDVVSTMLDELRRDEPFDDDEWEQLLSFAETIDPSLGELWHVIDPDGIPAHPWEFIGHDLISAEQDVDDDDELAAAEVRIIAVLEESHGSLTAALEHHLSVAEDHEQLMAAALDAVEPPHTEHERAAQFAAYLIDNGFFDRLARPRTAAYRTLVAMNDLFLSAQELGPDEPPTAPDSDTPEPTEPDSPLAPATEPGEPNTPVPTRQHAERGTNPSDTTAVNLEALQALVVTARQRMAEKERREREAEQAQRTPT